MSYHEEIIDIGIVNFVPNRNAKRMNLTVRGINQIRVAIPPGTSLKKAKDFVISQKEWIKKQIARREDIFEGPFPEKPLKTRLHSIYLIPEKRSNGLLSFENQQALIKYPSEMGIENPFVQKLILKAKEHVYEREAIIHIPERLIHLAQKYEFKYRDFCIKKTKSSWGSCNQHGIISISCHVMKLPDELIDFVLLHELCHTRFFNHSPGFKTLLNDVSRGRRIEFEAKLKQYRIN